jgi:hypothetical protein
LACPKSASNTTVNCTVRAIPTIIMEQHTPKVPTAAPVSPDHDPRQG